jgi:ATP-dependent Lhr-like helicase
MQLVVHAPFGGRVNRGLGLTLRKRICRSFDFELQAAANDDAVVLSLGPQHSFPLEQFQNMLSAKSLPETLSQAVLDSPMFTARWRWNLGRSLAVLRFRGGKKNPPPIQRMEADDLMAAMWPGLAQCQENQAGPIEIPDHPIVRQTLHDCLTEAMDAESLAGVLGSIEAGEIRVHHRDTTEPSPICHEILNSKPYTFLDNAPLEERRTRAVMLRRGLPEDARDLGRLDEAAIARVREEAGAAPRDPEELHDALLSLGATRPLAAAEDFFEDLVRAGRAARGETPAGTMWLATERRALFDALHPGALVRPDVRMPHDARAAPPPSAEEATTYVLRGHLDTRGPSSLRELADATGLPGIHVEQAAARLEAEGFVLRGHFDSTRPRDEEQLCARRLLARIHAYTQERLRKEIEPVTAQDLMRFLLRWQHVAPGTRREGRRGTLAVIEQLQGFELAAGSWEESVLPARVAGYKPEWLDALCLSGEVVWGRLGVKLAGADEAEVETSRGGAVPSRATPLCLARRDDLRWLLAATRGDASPRLPGSGAAHDVFAVLTERGALFQSELVAETRRLPVEVEQGLWDLVSRGLVAADGYQSLRSLLGVRSRRGPGRGRSGARGRLRRGGRGRLQADGRWALLPAADPGGDRDDLSEALVEQLLTRWGVVFRDLMQRETLAIPWREILYALRRMEARGTVRGGRFVTGFVGEQYALPGAVDALRQTRRIERSGEVVELSGVDPLNLSGVVTPGPRVPAVRTQRVIYRDGVPVSQDEAASAGGGA